MTFFPAEYSQISELPETKQKRLNSIAQEALEQSGGNMPTHINYSKASTQELLEEKKENMMHIIAAINGQSSIDLSAYGISEIALWVGPE
ncbi:16S rRNA (uracil(1498)-N(3))-methyltransferase [Candidatus Peribacteria bacterium]|nr:16S rRNA (uracil(1498)-N(3))-methyltransferase [Candidatus Peribacteria bacterium]